MEPLQDVWRQFVITPKWYIPLSIRPFPLNSFVNEKDKNMFILVPQLFARTQRRFVKRNWIALLIAMEEAFVWMITLVGVIHFIKGLYVGNILGVWDLIKSFVVLF
jgi:hypothetical protein